MEIVMKAATLVYISFHMQVVFVRALHCLNYLDPRLAFLKASDVEMR